MTKEELIALYPKDFDLLMYVALGGIAIFVGVVLIAIGYSLARKMSSDWDDRLIFGGMAIMFLSLIGLIFHALNASESYVRQEQEWNDKYYVEYLDTLKEESFEVSELIQKEDKGYLARIKKDGITVEVPVDEVEFVHNSKEAKMTGKFVEGLDEYGISTGYKDVTVVYPAE